MRSMLCSRNSLNQVTFSVVFSRRTCELPSLVGNISFKLFKVAAQANAFRTKVELLASAHRFKPANARGKTTFESLDLLQSQIFSVRDRTENHLPQTANRFSSALRTKRMIGAA